MKYWRYLIAISLIAVSCQKKGVNTPEIILLFDESFEQNGVPTHENWIVDPTLTSFAEDTPVNGGEWSLQLSPGWLPLEGSAEITLAGDTVQAAYELSVRVKCINGGSGYILMGFVYPDHQFDDFKTVSFDNPEWTAVSLSDTASLGENDRILIRLSAGSTELAGWDVLFDLVRVEEIR